MIQNNLLQVMVNLQLSLESYEVSDWSLSLKPGFHFSSFGLKFKDKFSNEIEKKRIYNEWTI